MWGHFGFSNFPDGRRYAEFLTGLFPADGDIQSLSRLAQNALYYHEGETEPIPQDLPEFLHRLQIPAGIRKTGPWTVCLSGLIAPTDLINNFFLDRQGNLSIYHSKPGLIVTGANSKRQPELATFTETIGGQITHMPLTSDLRMEDNTNRLALSYHTFFAVLEVTAPTARQMNFSFHTVYKWGEAQSELNLQLVLKSGKILECGNGQMIKLGNDHLELGEKELSGSIRHNGWKLKIPPAARLIWPVYPFNPYRNGPENEIEYAVGVLSLPLAAKDQDISFILETE